MSVLAAARRYAEALADVATEHDEVEQVISEVDGFVGLMRTNPELRGVFASPVISKDDKGRVLQSILERIRLSPHVANLLKVLLRHSRLHHLDAVAEQFRREINERRGIVVARVTTPASLDAEARRLLTEKIESITGKRAQLEFETDPSLIGGVVTRLGSTVYDGSIRTRLNGIRERLKEGSI